MNRLLSRIKAIALCRCSGKGIQPGGCVESNDHGGFAKEFNSSRNRRLCLHCLLCYTQK